MSATPKYPSPLPRTPWAYRVMGRLLAPVERLCGIDCRTFTRTASARLDGPLTLRQSFTYRLHRALCSICRRQDIHARHLHELLGLAARRQAFNQDVQLNENARHRIHQKLVEEMQRH